MLDKYFKGEIKMAKIIKETIEIIKNKMENCVKLNVPLRVSVEYGKNWGEFH